MDLTQIAIKEKAKRELLKRHKNKQENLTEFIKYFFKHEKGKDFDDNWHYDLIASKLNQVLTGDCTRLIINIPPGSGKTELITKCFPVWALGKNPKLQICATGYSTSLTQTYSQEARDYYKSKTFARVFPRIPKLRKDQDTKEWWTNEEGGGYYATGCGGSITGRRFNIFIIDDPIKPDEAESDVKRIGINNWYENTVLSRLFNPLKDAVIIIMQRTHDDDLCGHLIGKMEEGTGEKWDMIILPAIAEEDHVPYRMQGEALQANRYPIEALDTIKQSLGAVNFSCQYQQRPLSKETQEIHEEWFKYYDFMEAGRVFTACDPAFSKKLGSDETSIISARFVEDRMYILEYSHGKFDPAELEDKLIYHIKKWCPEKIGIESFQAQSMILFSLKNRLKKENIYTTTVEEIRQSGDKDTKIRRLIPLYRNGLIFHKPGMDELEKQLLQFPRGKHDDIIDSEQMLYDLYALQPNTNSFQRVRIEYDQFGRPKVL